MRTVDEVRDFMAGREPVDFHLTDRRGAYDFVTRTLRRLSYAGLTKADKGVVRRFVAKVTGLLRAQSTRLIGQYQNTGHIRDRRCGATRPLEWRYMAVDIRLLAKVDETLGGLCGPTTRRVMRRVNRWFGGCDRLSHTLPQGIVCDCLEAAAVSVPYPSKQGSHVRIQCQSRSHASERR